MFLALLLSLHLGAVHLSGVLSVSHLTVQAGQKQEVKEEGEIFLPLSFSFTSGFFFTAREIKIKSLL